MLAKLESAGKKLSLALVALFLALSGYSQPTPPAHPVTEDPKDSVNYILRVEWKEPKNDPKFIEVTTSEGQFQLDTIQKNSVKINNDEIPVTLKLTGTLTAFDSEKGKLQLFLGRTVPYVASTFGNGSSMSSSYSQLSVGLHSTFAVKFGKPLIVQNDENGEIVILVKREEN
jgi:hypothetical protein